MDFNNYINQLGKLDKQEIEVELNNFYTFNSGLFQFFKAIDEQFQSLLNSSNLNAKSIETILLQANQILPELNNLKFEISMFENDKLSEQCKNDFLKTTKYIKESMVISEVEITKQRFLKLLKVNEIKYQEEQIENEKRKQGEIEEQKRLEKEKKEKLRIEEEKKEKALLEIIRKEKEEKERLRKEEERKRKDEVDRQEKERLGKIRNEAEIKEKLRLEEERKIAEQKRLEQERLNKIRKVNEEKERIKQEVERNKREEEEKKKKEDVNLKNELDRKLNISRSKANILGRTYNTIIIKWSWYDSTEINFFEVLADDIEINFADKFFMGDIHSDTSYLKDWHIPSETNWKFLKEKFIDKFEDFSQYNSSYLKLDLESKYLYSDKKELKSSFFGLVGNYKMIFGFVSFYKDYQYKINLDFIEENIDNNIKVKVRLMRYNNHE